MMISFARATKHAASISRQEMMGARHFNIYAALSKTAFVVHSAKVAVPKVSFFGLLMQIFRILMQSGPMRQGKGH